MLRKLFFDSQGVLRSGWALLAFFAAWTLLSFAGRRLPLPPLPGELAKVLPYAGRLVAISFATWLGCRLVRQPIAAVGLPRAEALGGLGRGALLGAGFVSLVCAVPALLGYSELAWDLPGAARLPSQLLWLGGIAVISISEELVLRGFLFQQLARGLHPVAAVGVTGLLFGVAHLQNPHASLVAVAVIALVGVWFGLLRWFTGALWVPIGLHISWNWFEGFVWGHPVSGLAFGTFLLRRVSFRDHGGWTGGEFGPEASVLVAVCLVAAIAITLWCARRNACLTVGSGR